MLQTVESNRTLLVDGPASVKVVSGKVEVFGFQLKRAQKVVVREGKRLPFFVVEKADFDISLGPGATVEESAGTTTPNSWNKPLGTILGMQKKPTVVLILGKIDSGKSSYCTYLLNRLVDGKRKVAVLDGDLGQSDIGPSGTVGYALTSGQKTELYDLKLENAIFIGVTSPILAIAGTIDALAALKAEILNRNVDFLVVNTDGWVTGDIAIRYKTSLVKELKPDVIVGIQATDELKALIAILDQSVLTVESPISLSPRTAEKRKNIRDATYVKYLNNAKTQSYPINHLAIEPRGAFSKYQTPEKGTLVGLYNSAGKFLGIGVLREINPTRRSLRVQTSVTAQPAKLVLGKIILDEKLKEVTEQV